MCLGNAIAIFTAQTNTCVLMAWMEGMKLPAIHRLLERIGLGMFCILLRWNTIVENNSLLNLS